MMPALGQTGNPHATEIIFISNASEKHVDFMNIFLSGNPYNPLYSHNSQVMKSLR